MRAFCISAGFGVPAQRSAPRYLLSPCRFRRHTKAELTMYAWMLMSTVAEIMLREWFGMGISRYGKGLPPVAAATMEG